MSSHNLPLVKGVGDVPLAEVLIGENISFGTSPWPPSQGGELLSN